MADGSIHVPTEYEDELVSVIDVRKLYDDWKKLQSEGSEEKDL